MYKDLGGRMFFGLGFELGQNLFLDSVSGTAITLGGAFFPKGFAQLLIRLSGSSKGGAGSFLELEGGYRLAVASGSHAFGSAIDLGAQLYYNIPADSDLDFRVSMRASMKPYVSTGWTQSNITLVGVLGLAWR